MLTKFYALRERQGFMRYFYNTSWLLGERIFRMAVGLFVGIWIARYLGPEQFGLFSYVQSFVGLFAVIATLGLDGIVVRELVKDESKRDELLGTAFWLKLMGAFVVLAILAVAIIFTSNDSYTNTLVFIIASATIFQSFNVIDFYFQSKVMGKYITFANVISLFLSSIIKVIFIVINAPLIAFAWMILFDSFILALGYIYFYIKNISDVTFKIFIFNKSLAMLLLKDSWFFILILISAMIYERIDQVMIKEMLDITSVGLYSVSTRIYAVVVGFSPIFAYSFQTALISAHQISIEQFEKRLILLYSLAIWTILPTSIVISFYAQEIISLVFGEKYAGAEESLKIYIYCSVFAFIGGISSRWFIIYNSQKFMTTYLLMSAFLNIILNTFLIPKYGIYGAGLASVIAFSFSATFSNLLHSKTYRNFELQCLSIGYPLILIYRKFQNVFSIKDK